MGKGYALLIGLQGVDPTKHNGWDGKKGCEGVSGDLDRMSKVLGKSTYQFEILRLESAKATHNSILTQIRSKAAQLVPDDIFVFYYSGHGGGPGTVEEATHKRDTFVCYDKAISEDEMRNAFMAFKPGVRVVTVVDACHSGTDIDGLNFVKNIHGSGKHFSAEVIHLGACRDTESATGYPNGGAFTLALFEEMQRREYISYHGLMKAVQARPEFAKLNSKQHPQVRYYGGAEIQFSKEQSFFVSRILVAGLPVSQIEANILSQSQEGRMYARQRERRMSYRTTVKHKQQPAQSSTTSCCVLSCLAALFSTATTKPNGYKLLENGGNGIEMKKMTRL